MAITALMASEQLGVSVDTIRRWDKKGLIKSTRDSRKYRIFDLDEIRRLQNKLHSTAPANTFTILKSRTKTAFTAIELFAGAGGTALGFENAGLNHLLLSEIDKDCVETLTGNLKGANIVPGDVRTADFTQYRGRADIVQAGFPCQAFSYAGKKLGFEEARGTLFFEFARCIRETRPKIAVGENVRGLLNHDNGKTLRVMLAIFDELGYGVRYSVLRSQYLDVPQKRERLIMIAVRKDLDMPFLFPREKDYTVSLREALKDCPRSEGQKYPKKKYEILKRIPEAQGKRKQSPYGLLS